MQPLVSVCCITYNHAPYIRQCLDGILMQKTNFPFEVIINDDCSIDGTTEIIKDYANKYPNIIKPIYHEENMYRKGVHSMYLRYCVPEVRGKYIALCDGDDFWDNANKLQLQFNFMEHHPEYGMVHTDYDLTIGYKTHNLKRINVRDDGIYFPTILYERINVGACTAFIRKSVLDECPKYMLSNKWPMGDYPLWIEISKLSKIGYIDKRTARYRILEESASHSNDMTKMINYKTGFVKMRQFYAQLYNVKLPNDGYDADYYESIVRNTCRIHDVHTAMLYYNEAKARNITSIRIKVFYLATRFPIIKKLLELYQKV